jgi:hypothetical protein
MCRDTVKPGVMGLATDEPDKFREIDVGRAPDTALRTGQATPYGVVRRLFQLIQRALYDLPGRKIGKHLSNRAASSAHAAVKTVIGLGCVNQFS